MISGLEMLLHQAFAQVEQFTGRPAPKEAMSAALGRTLACRSMGAGLAVACVLAWLAALSVYDVRQRRLPNALTLPGAVGGAGRRGAGRARRARAVSARLALTALYLGVHLVAPAAMGAGDVKLAIGVGALTGAFGVDAWVARGAGGAATDGGVGSRRGVPQRAGPTGTARRRRGPSRTVRRCVSPTLAAVALVVV